MITFLFSSWEWIVAASTAISLFSAITLIYSLTHKKTSPEIVRAFGMVGCVLGVSFICASCFVGMKFTEVPNVRGLSIRDAQSKLEEVELEIDLNEDLATEEHWQEKVLSQSPNASEIVAKGSLVTVSIYEILDNESEDDPSSEVDDSPSSETPSSSVSSSDSSNTTNSDSSSSSVTPTPTPTPEPTPEPTPVNTKVEVPYVVGMEQTKATSLLTSLGLNFQVWWTGEHDYTAEHYYVLGQSIEVGTEVDTGTLVKLEIAPETAVTSAKVTVPYVVGMKQTQATELLTSLGLNFQVWWTKEHDISSEVYYIIGQSIDAGTEVDAGTLVKLELSPYQP